MAKEYILHQIIECGYDGEDALLASEIDWASIIREYVEDCACLPGFEEIVYTAIEDFAISNGLKYSADYDDLKDGISDIWGYYNGASDTHICVSSKVDDDLVTELENYLGPDIDVEIYDLDEDDDFDEEYEDDYDEYDEDDDFQG